VIPLILIPSLNSMENAATGSADYWTGILRSGEGLDATISIINDAGGTTDLPPGTYRVRLLEHWYDDETGIRCIGELLDERDIETARRAGTTGYKPEDYLKYSRAMFEKTRKAAETFDPRRVYFCFDDLTPETHGNAS